MLKWDGSEITDLFHDENVLIEEAILEKTIFWRIEIDNKEEFCLVRNCKTTLPCLIDELKPVFNLEKIGTHWIKYNGKKLILLKLISKDGVVTLDCTLDKIGYKKSLENTVQKIFVFRELLGLSKSYEKSIILRKIGTFIMPISFYEPNMSPENEKKIIPDNVLNTWFINDSIDSVVKKLFSIDSKEDIIKLTYILRTQMEEIVNRVDKSSIGKVGEILARILSRLQYILD